MFVCVRTSTVNKMHSEAAYWKAQVKELISWPFLPTEEHCCVCLPSIKISGGNFSDDQISGCHILLTVGVVVAVCVWPFDSARIQVLTCAHDRLISGGNEASWTQENLRMKHHLESKWIVTNQERWEEGQVESFRFLEAASNQTHRERSKKRDSQPASQPIERRAKCELEYTTTTTTTATMLVMLVGQRYSLEWGV